MYINNVKCIIEYTHKIKTDYISHGKFLLVVLLPVPLTSTYFSNKQERKRLLYYEPSFSSAC